jgi:hypothetical protein
MYLWAGHTREVYDLVLRLQDAIEVPAYNLSDAHPAVVNIGFEIRNAAQRLLFADKLKMRIKSAVVPLLDKEEEEEEDDQVPKPETEWAESLALKLPGASQRFRFRMPDDRAEMECVAVFSSAPEQYLNTRILSILPAFILVNHLSYALAIKQDTCETYLELQSKEEKQSFYWTDGQKSNEIRVTLDPRREQWSGRISLDNLDSYHVQIPGYPDPDSWIMITLRLQNHITFVVFEDGNKNFPMFFSFSRFSQLSCSCNS